MMAEYKRMTVAKKNAIIRHCLPALTEIGQEMHRHLVVETAFDTGDLRDDAYASVDDVTGRVEIGYDETGRERPHGYYYTFGTSEMDGDPALMRVAYFARRPRRGDGRRS